MKQPTPTEPNMAAIPEIYSTMPNKWAKWTPKPKNEPYRRLSYLRYGFQGKPLSS
jgi:hypothetical protein